MKKIHSVCFRMACNAFFSYVALTVDLIMGITLSQPFSDRICKTNIEIFELKSISDVSAAS